MKSGVSLQVGMRPQALETVEQTAPRSSTSVDEWLNNIAFNRTLQEEIAKLDDRLRALTYQLGHLAELITANAQALHTRGEKPPHQIFAMGSGSTADIEVRLTGLERALAQVSQKIDVIGRQALDTHSQLDRAAIAVRFIASHLVSALAKLSEEVRGLAGKIDDAARCAGSGIVSPTHGGIAGPTDALASRDHAAGCDDEAVNTPIDDKERPAADAAGGQGEDRTAQPVEELDAARAQCELSASAPARPRKSVASAGFALANLIAAARRAAQAAGPGGPGGPANNEAPVAITKPSALGEVPKRVSRLRALVAATIAMLIALAGLEIARTLLGFSHKATVSAPSEVDAPEPMSTLPSATARAGDGSGDSASSLLPAAQAGSPDL